MSEGGLFAWKRQEIDVHRGPAVNYAHLNDAPSTKKEGEELKGSSSK